MVSNMKELLIGQNENESLGTCSVNDLLFQLRLIDEENGAASGMRINKGREVLREILT
jgi:hypothetical protein